MTADEKTSLLRDGERADDLQSKGLRLIQSPASFCFGTDSVLLTHYALDALGAAKRGKSIVDLGAGSGFISIMLAGHTGLCVSAVELDESQCSRLERSALLNGFDGEKLRVVNADYIRETAEPAEKYDYAIANPPYFGINTGGTPTNEGATHEKNADIEGVCLAAARRIKYGGKFFFCFPANRLASAFAALNKSGLEPKKLRLCASKPGKKPYLALITAIKGAKPGLDIERELVICAEDGRYTPEVEGWYNG